MCKHFIGISLLAFLLLPIGAHCVPITYDFQAVGKYLDMYGVPPPVPPELAAASEWDIRGSIIVDNDEGAVSDDPYIRLGRQIVGGSLSVNGFSTGAFDSASFRYYFMDGFAASSRPYDAMFELSFAASDELGPS